ncbi:DNA-directed RNA polymerase subunit P [archaeon]|nr:DNA-directed RNA polymerase subunit P [archaeon]MBT6697872.1 DNA-directed RNA polymerase subunit P [archaeon]
MNYTCFDCGKDVDQSYTVTRVRCPYCGSKILYKGRSVTVTVKAR